MEESITVNNQGVYNISFSTVLDMMGSPGLVRFLTFSLSINGIPLSTCQTVFYTLDPELNTVSRTEQLM